MKKRRVMNSEQFKNTAGQILLGFKAWKQSFVAHVPSSQPEAPPWESFPFFFFLSSICLQLNSFMSLFLACRI